MTVSATNGCCGVIAGGPVAEPAQPEPAATCGPGAEPVSAPPTPDVTAGGPADSYCAEPVQVEQCVPAPVQTGCGTADTAAPAAPAAPATKTVVDADSGVQVDASTGKPVKTDVPPAAEKDSSADDTPPAPVTTAGAPTGTSSSPDEAKSGSTPPSSDPASPAPGTPSQPPVPAVASGPAGQLPTWPQWQQAFAALGVDANNIARIAGQPLTNEQLAQVFVAMKRALDSQRAAKVPGTPGTVPGTPGVPGTSGTPGATSAWSPAWEQKFAAIGATPQDIAQLKALAAEKSMTDADLEQLHQELAKGAGWSPQWEQKFKALGGAELSLPKEFLDAYKSSATTGPALQAAYDHAAQRLAAFKARNGGKTYDELMKAKADPGVVWTAILSNKIPGDVGSPQLVDATDEHVHRYCNRLQAKNKGAWTKRAQFALNFFPGVELAQLALGKRFLTGKEIDQTSPLNIVLAGMSGVAAFTAFRGAANLRAGFQVGKAARASANGGKPLFLEQAAAFGGGTLDDGVRGAMELTTMRRIASIAPLTPAHQQRVGFGLWESAAKSYVNGGREALLTKGATGKVQTAVLDRMFADLARGETVLVGNRFGYLGNLRPVLPFKQRGEGMLLDGEIITAAKATKAKDGNAILAGLLEVGGSKMAVNPHWLGKGVDDALQAMGGGGQLSGVGKRLAGESVEVLKADVHSGVMGPVMARFAPGHVERLGSLRRSAAEAGRLADDAGKPDAFQQFTAQAAKRLSGARAARHGADDVADGIAHGDTALVDALTGAGSFPLTLRRIVNGKEVEKTYNTARGFRSALSQKVGTWRTSDSGKTLYFTKDGQQKAYRSAVQIEDDLRKAMGTPVAAGA